MMVTKGGIAMDVRRMIEDVVDESLGVGREKVKLTVVLPVDLYEDLRRVAYERHESQNAIVRRALRAWLAREVNS